MEAFENKIKELNDCIDSLDNELILMRKFIREKGLLEEALLYVANNLAYSDLKS